MDFGPAPDAAATRRGVGDSAVRAVVGAVVMAKVLATVAASTHTEVVAVALDFGPAQDAAATRMGAGVAAVRAVVLATVLDAVVASSLSEDVAVAAAAVVMFAWLAWLRWDASCASGTWCPTFRDAVDSSVHVAVEAASVGAIKAETPSMMPCESTTGAPPVHESMHLLIRAM